MLFVALALTDIFDGMIARLVKKSGMGKIIDSTADKAMIFSGLLFLYAEGLFSHYVVAMFFFEGAIILIIVIYGIGLLLRQNVPGKSGISNIIKRYQKAKKRF